MMLDEDFCIFLEYRISEAFQYSDDRQFRHFWCDGVLLPDNENEYCLKWVNDKRQVVMKAYFGETGQELYQLNLRFGSKALSRYQRGLTVKECVPGPENTEWIEIDLLKKVIAIQLF